MEKIIKNSLYGDFNDDIEKLMFRKTSDMITLDKYTLLDIIEALQNDLNHWKNQYVTIHNDYVDLQKENEKLNKTISDLENENKYLTIINEHLKEELKGS